MYILYEYTFSYECILYICLSHWVHCKKEPNWRYSFCIVKCGEWGSNNRENYTDLPLRPLPLIHRRKKISSLYQILFQIMLSGTSVSWEGWGALQRVSKWKNEKSCQKKKKGGKKKSHWKLISTNAIVWKLSSSCCATLVPRQQKLAWLALGHIKLQAKMSLIRYQIFTRLRCFSLMLYPNLFIIAILVS